MTNEEAIELLKQSKLCTNMICGDPLEICRYSNEVEKAVEKAIEALERQTHICGNCAYNENTCYNHGVMEPRCRFANFKLKEDDYCSRWEEEQ